MAIQPMKWEDIPKDTRNRLMNQSGEQVTEAAFHLGIHPETLKRRLREWRAQVAFAQKISATGQVPLPQLSTRVYNDFLVLDGDDAILTSDWELPYTDLALIKTETKPHR